MGQGARPILLMTLMVVALGAICLLSLALGAASIPPDQVVRALFGDPPSRLVDNIVWSARVPRTALGLTAGAALGLSGAVMQALTRNPLADPGVLGVSAGASFAIVLAAGVFGLGSFHGYIWFAFAGALAASILVYLLGGLGRSGPTPVKLALAGASVTSLLSSLTSAVVLTDPDALDRYRFWSAGSMADQDGATVLRMLPILLVGTVLALALAPALNSMALGDDVAASLGRRLGLVRLQGVAAVTLLTGAAVAAIGPVVFIGLVAPTWPASSPGRRGSARTTAGCCRCPPYSRPVCCSPRTSPAGWSPGSPRCRPGSSSPSSAGRSSSPWSAGTVWRRCDDGRVPLRAPGAEVPCGRRAFARTVLPRLPARRTARVRDPPAPAGDAVRAARHRRLPPVLLGAVDRRLPDRLHRGRTRPDRLRRPRHRPGGAGTTAAAGPGGSADRDCLRRLRRPVPDHDPQSARHPRHDRPHQGAGTAVVTGIVLGWDGGLGTQTLGLLGALVTALVVYALAWRRGATGYRIILVGIGVAWICTSATDCLMTKGGRFQAQAALGWLVGNLNGRTWYQTVPLVAALAVLLPAALLLGRLLRTLQLGDDVATGLGTVQPVRLAVLLTGVGLIAFATAAAGPVAFVALAAPQIAQRLAGTAWPPTVASGLAGALRRPHRPHPDLRHGTAGRNRHRRARRARPALAARPHQPRGIERLIHVG